MTKFRTKGKGEDRTVYPLSKKKINMPKYMPPNIKSPTMLMTKEMKREIPPLYSQENKKPEDVTVHAHYFTPFSSWDWYITEYDGKDTMFGLVKGHDTELGYISLSELEKQGMNIERDRHWSKKSLAEVMKETKYPHYKEKNENKDGDRITRLKNIQKESPNKFYNSLVSGKLKLNKEEKKALGLTGRDIVVVELNDTKTGYIVEKQAFPPNVNRDKVAKQMWKEWKNKYNFNEKRTDGHYRYVVTDGLIRVFND